jgi:hypothetical protein
MRYFIAIFLLPLFTSLLAKAQSTDPLVQDSRGRYSFTHVSQVTDVPKEVLYERLKSFVVNDLNASDNHLSWDDVNHDSISTVAFIELPNTTEMSNQIISAKARVRFINGAATLALTGFIYNGTDINTGQPYSKQLHRMEPINYASQSWARLALAGILEQLAERMDELASGKATQRSRQQVKKS